MYGNSYASKNTRAQKQMKKANGNIFSDESTFHYILLMDSSVDLPKGFTLGSKSRLGKLSHLFVRFV